MTLAQEKHAGRMRERNALEAVRDTERAKREGREDKAFARLGFDGERYRSRERYRIFWERLDRWERLYVQVWANPHGFPNNPIPRSSLSNIFGVTS